MRKSHFDAGKTSQKMG